jgi:hypothetical protein
MSGFAALLDGFRAYLASRASDTVSRFTEGFDWDMAVRDVPPKSLPVVGHLGKAAMMAGGGEGLLLSALAAQAETLAWGQTYNTGDFSQAFLDGYGWVELFGERGVFASHDMAGGFLMLGPDIHYPDHHHVAQEIYVPLTDGSLWSKDGGAFQPRQPGEIIHHPSDIRHAMRTGDEPLVALYLWRGGPLAQKSIISGETE